MILLAYDGSEDARAAIDGAARLMPGKTATVLTVWEPFVASLTAGGAMGMADTAIDVVALDESLREAARATAAEGAAYAARAGLTAQAREEMRHHTVAATILGVAEELDADVIVTGTRGRGGMTSFLLGSVSHAVLQHADRPVLTLPSSGLAARRRQVFAGAAAEPAERPKGKPEVSRPV